MPVSVGAGPDLAATVAQLQRRMDEMQSQMGPVTSLTRARKRAAVTAPPGTVVFMEPDADPVVTYPAPEVPARGKRGLR